MHNFSLITLKNIMISIGDTNDLCLWHLNLESFCLIFHCSSKHRRMGYVENRQHWNADLCESLLAVKKHHADGIVYRLWSRDLGKIVLSLLQLLFKLMDFDKELINLFRASWKCAGV